MKALPLASFAVTVLAAALAMPYSPRVEASAGIQRCQSNDGSVVYTDKACGALGADALPISRELTTRIASDRRNDVRTDDALIDGLGVVDASTPAPTRSVGRRSILSGCAESPTQLTMDLQGAMALGDINRIAESYHWVGMSTSAGQRTLARLEALAARNLVDVRFFDATIQGGLGQFADASQPLDESSSAGGVMQLSFGAGASTHSVMFDVEKYQGCYFIRF